MREDHDMLHRDSSSSTPADRQGRDIGPDSSFSTPADRQGRDIGPDEIRLTSDPQISDTERDREPAALDSDVDEDTCCAVSCQDTLGNRHHVPDRQPPAQPWHLYNEVLDESSNLPLNRHPIDVKREEDRLSTFIGWRYQMVVRKEDLARNGFVYTGTADKVRCVFCNTLVRQWEPQDAVEPTHRSFSPDCPFVLGHNVGNVPMSVQQQWQQQPAGACQIPYYSPPGPSASAQVIYTRQSLNGTSGASVPPMISAEESGPQALNHSSPSSSLLPRNPRMAVEPERLASFQSWPSQINQKPEELAVAGLYYTGDGDKVKCFYCDVLLYNWEPRDDPFREHARFSRHCAYLQLVKGSEFIEDVHNPAARREKTEDGDEMMDSPAVKALLFDGQSKETIQRALAVLREKNVEGDKVTAEKLMLTVMDMEQPASAVASAFASASQSSTSQHSEDVQVLQQENEILREKQQCKICMERDVAVIFFPCKHLVCCAICASGVTACPICRMPIQGREKIFMS